MWDYWHIDALQLQMAFQTIDGTKVAFNNSNQFTAVKTKITQSFASERKGEAEKY